MIKVDEHADDNCSLKNEDEQEVLRLERQSLKLRQKHTKLHHSAVYVESLHSLYHRLDLNGDGKLSVQELILALKNDAEVATLFGLSSEMQRLVDTATWVEYFHQVGVHVDFDVISLDDFGQHLSSKQPSRLLLPQQLFKRPPSSALSASASSSTTPSLNDHYSVMARILSGCRNLMTEYHTREAKSTGVRKSLTKMVELAIQAKNEQAREVEVLGIVRLSQGNALASSEIEQSILPPLIDQSLLGWKSSRANYYRSSIEVLDMTQTENSFYILSVLCPLFPDACNDLIKRVVHRWTHKWHTAATMIQTQWKLSQCQRNTEVPAFVRRQQIIMCLLDADAIRKVWKALSSEEDVHTCALKNEQTAIEELVESPSRMDVYHLHLHIWATLTHPSTCPQGYSKHRKAFVREGGLLVLRRSFDPHPDFGHHDTSHLAIHILLQLSRVPTLRRSIVSSGLCQHVPHMFDAMEIITAATVNESSYGYRHTRSFLILDLYVQLVSTSDHGNLEDQFLHEQALERWLAVQSNFLEPVFQRVFHQQQLLHVQVVVIIEQLLLLCHAWTTANAHLRRAFFPILWPYLKPLLMCGTFLSQSSVSMHRCVFQILAGFSQELETLVTLCERQELLRSIIQEDLISSYQNNVIVAPKGKKKKTKSKKKSHINSNDDVEARRVLILLYVQNPSLFHQRALFPQDEKPSAWSNVEKRLYPRLVYILKQEKHIRRQFVVAFDRDQILSSILMFLSQEKNLSSDMRIVPFPKLLTIVKWFEMISKYQVTLFRPPHLMILCQIFCQISHVLIIQSAVVTLNRFISTLSVDAAGPLTSREAFFDTLFQHQFFQHMFQCISAFLSQGSVGAKTNTLVLQCLSQLIQCSGDASTDEEQEEEGTKARQGRIYHAVCPSLIRLISRCLEYHLEGQVFRILYEAASVDNGVSALTQLGIMDCWYSLIHDQLLIPEEQIHHVTPVLVDQRQRKRRHDRHLKPVAQSQGVYSSKVLRLPCSFFGLVSRLAQLPSNHESFRSTKLFHLLLHRLSVTTKDNRTLLVFLCTCLHQLLVRRDSGSSICCDIILQEMPSTISTLINLFTEPAPLVFEAIKIILLLLRMDSLIAGPLILKQQHVLKLVWQKKDQSLKVSKNILDLLHLVLSLYPTDHLALVLIQNSWIPLLFQSSLIPSSNNGDSSIHSKTEQKKISQLKKKILKLVAQLEMIDQKNNTSATNSPKKVSLHLPQIK